MQISKIHLSGDLQLEVLQPTFHKNKNRERPIANNTWMKSQTLSSSKNINIFICKENLTFFESISEEAGTS
jgi:hypothetical protein